MQSLHECKAQKGKSTDQGEGMMKENPLIPIVNLGQELIHLRLFLPDIDFFRRGRF